MKGEKINFIINSKNRDILINPSASTVDVVIPSGLLQLKKSKLPPLISLEYLINEVKKQEQKEALNKKVPDVLEV